MKLLMLSDTDYREVLEALRRNVGIYPVVDRKRNLRQKKNRISKDVRGPRERFAQLYMYVKEYATTVPKWQSRCCNLGPIRTEDLHKDSAVGTDRSGHKRKRLYFTDKSSA